MTKGDWFLPAPRVQQHQLSCAHPAARRCDQKAGKAARDHLWFLTNFVCTRGCLPCAGYIEYIPNFLNIPSSRKAFKMFTVLLCPGLHSQKASAPSAAVLAGGKGSTGFSQCLKFPALGSLWLHRRMKTQRVLSVF